MPIRIGFIVLVYFLITTIIHKCLSKEVEDEEELIECFHQSPSANFYSTNVFTCPTPVQECFKYVCVGNVYYIQRGCLDPQSPTQNCQAVQTHCKLNGGTGSCYTCNTDRCNKSLRTTPFAFLLLIALLAPTALSVCWTLSEISYNRSFR